MKNILAIVCGLCVIPTLLMGCGKLNKDNTTPEQDASAVMANVLQLPLPDSSYASTNAPAARSASNFGNFAQTVDVLASSIQESQLHLQQTLDQGKRENGSLHVTLASQGTDLTGTRNDAAGTIAWTFSHGSTAIFTGSETTFGGTGDLTFAAAGITVHWDISAASGASVKTVVVRQNATGSNLTFTETLNADGTPKVSMTGLKNGTLTVTAQWDATGGSYQEGANPKTCWGPSPNFANVAPCPAVAAAKSTK